MRIFNHALGFGLWLSISCAVCFSLLPYDNKLSGNLIVTSLLFFNNLNILIAILEIILG